MKIIGYTAVLFLLFFLSCDRKENFDMPKVTAVYPSADTLPENLLRMYIQFSKPMRAIGNLEHISLRDENDSIIEGAIFNNVYELWDREQKQLTIILDPSRVKTGLKANKEMGRALQVGKKYKLVIEKARDINDHPLAAAFTKTFLVKPADVIIPDTKQWTLKIPSANSDSALLVQFPQMLDHFSLIQRLKLTDKHNQSISGQIEIGKQEMEWRFRPTKIWSAGNYILYVNTRLEDPVGNNLNGLFDHQIGSLKNKREGTIEAIPFEIK